MEILDISEIPDNFDITQEALADDECYRITLEIMYDYNRIAGFIHATSKYIEGLT